MLIDAYGRCAEVADAEAVFSQIPRRELSIYSWNCLIGAYARVTHCIIFIVLSPSLMIHNIDPIRMEMDLKPWRG